MNAKNKWFPKHIDIEPSFDAFVSTFRSGRLVRELISPLSKMPLNAGYFFPNDNLIAELKCLQKNPVEGQDWPSRLIRAFNTTGHSFDEMMGYLFRGEKIPVPVKAKLVYWMRESIRGVVKTGNRQLRQTKREVSKSAKALLLIANEHLR